MPQDLPDMFEEIDRVEYSVLDNENRKVLDVLQGAKLFDLAGSMSDERDDRFVEANDAEESSLTRRIAATSIACPRVSTTHTNHSKH